ncbi:sugar dehydrogenase complex small subunit [Roseimicrobium sp. ORNL1]|uniref:sugar dehydrogenase complex small subunit n=1 Tax=Roseimicrobium sp. ORNL1 TaxID=2711231 RepID=UPI0013E11118|nr:sugar dehydrogenase complex small subunit [Roseimicrobium sp. ORNL1]QIF02018.1 hypothetical protein G5S37_10905 [Roseimicrobium sp. ORNL1]
MLDAFLALSRLVTGVRPLDPVLAESLLTRLIKAGLETRVLKACEVLAPLEAGEDGEEKAKALLLQDTVMCETVTFIVQLWYLGELSFPAKLEDRLPGEPEHAFRGLLWPLIHAHPPALSGGYFGHWTYPPDN